MRFGVDRRVLPVAAALVLMVCTSGLGASSAQAEGACANEQLRAEQPYGLELPDCRAYEMVSPLDKNGGNAAEAGEGEEFDRASVSGEAITYDSFGSFAEASGSRYLSQYLSRRGPDGWSTMGITPLFSTFKGSNIGSAYRYLIFTPDLSAGVAETDVPLTSEAIAGYLDFYVADLADGSYQLVTNGTPVGEPYEIEEYISPRIYGASTDLSHIVFTSHQDIYEWVDGRLSQVNIAPDGTEMAIRLPFAGLTTLWRGVSDDGLRVIMSGLSEPEQLYVRENPEQPQSPLNGEECTVSSDACTVDVSASQRTVVDPNGPQTAEYAGASVDGSRVFFTSKAELTNNANTGSADDAANFYEYDLESEQLTDLSVDTDAGDVDGAGVLGVVDISEDGSYVYFVAEGDLAAHAVSGQPNLYLEHEGAITLVATLSSIGDIQDWSRPPANIPSTVGINTVRETPDGTHLAFLSTRNLTGYDNEQATTGECEGYEEGGDCREVFSYDATSGTLVCVSCNPSGARPLGPSSLGNESGGEEVAHDDYTQRNFSEDGSRLFFQSKDALVVHDSNGRQDVYEYEDGHVFPVSDVAGNYDSSFVDASTNGDDVFIATTDQLLPQDTDFRLDVYDARVGGGFPLSVSPPACDNADSCKAPVSPQPSVFGTPASATFSGAGNVAPIVAAKPVVKPKIKAKLKRCEKGSVRKHGKCVKKSKKKAKKASESSKHSKKGRK